MKKTLLLLSTLIVGGFVYAQNDENVTIDVTFDQKNAQSKTYQLNEVITSLKSVGKTKQLSVNLPTLNNKSEQFILIERDLLAPKLKEKYSNIKSYYGYSTTNPNLKISLSYSDAKGLNAFVYSPNERYVIERDSETKTYKVIDSNQIPSLKNFKCDVSNDVTINNGEIQSKSNPNVYRKYRLAVATDYDFNKYHADLVGEEPSAEIAMAAIVEAVTYLSTVYENDLSISFELVDGLEDVAFLDSETNPFWDLFGIFNNLNTQTQIELDDKIGSENYDIGIILTNLVSGGNAGAIGSVCNDTTKGSAYAGRVGVGPEGAQYYMVIAHEMGHQFGANHTHARNESTQANREIGSGVTVMGYPGVTGSHDASPVFIEQFHHYNLGQINTYLNAQSCGTTTASTNQAPTADAGNDFVIPKGTAFKLNGVGTDADNDNLTYSWEQSDYLATVNTGTAFYDPKPTNLEGALYRVNQATDKPFAYFPPLKNVLNDNLYGTFNMPSDVARELNFAFLVRDNHVDGGQFADDKIKLTVAEAGPFKINNLELNQSLKSNTPIELTWDVADTDVAPINVSDVKILITTDDGETFETLVESTPNIGSATITIPAELASPKANIIVEAIDNIFYAASPIVAVDYEVTLDCETFETEGGAIPDRTNAGAGLFNKVLTVSGQEGDIENLGINVDITHASPAQLAVLFGKAGVDDIYQYMSYTHCGSTPNFVHQFNQFGQSMFTEGCEEGAKIQPVSNDLSKYVGAPINGNYNFRVADITAGTTGTVNKVGIEICKRKAETLSVNDLVKSNSFKVYPNPSNGNINVRFDHSTTSYTIEVVNVAGQIVYNKQFNNASKEIDQKLDLTSLTKGVYILKVNDGSSTKSQKVIIK